MIKRLSIKELEKILYKEKERIDSLPRDRSNMYTCGTAKYLLEVCDELDEKVKQMSQNTYYPTATQIRLYILTIRFMCEEILETAVPCE